MMAASPDDVQPANSPHDGTLMMAASPDDVQPANSPHDAVTDPDLVAPVVSSSVHDCAASAGAEDVTSSDGVLTPAALSFL